MPTILQQQLPDRNSVRSIEPITSDWTIEYGFDRPGSYQMERDEALARERVEAPGLPNVLRLYSWRPSAVSLGYQQKIESIDLEACKRDGVDVVRRPTGGRAVLHANELTYAIVMSTPAGSGIYASHNRIVEALLASLKDLGDGGTALRITDRSADQNFKEVYKPGSLTNAACFASSARHEVVLDGKKVIGSAQRRFGSVLLQHGSILLCEEHLTLPEYLAISDEDRKRMLEHLKRETSTLSQVFGRAISAEEAANCIAASFPSHICRGQDSGDRV